MLNEEFPECVLMKNGDKITLVFETDADASVGFDAIERLLAIPSSPVSDLVERLREGVHTVGLHEDNETELFDIESADEAMAEAADRLTALEAENARLMEVLAGTRSIVCEGAMTGFDCHNGDWAERLYCNNGVISQSLRTFLAPQGGDHEE